MPSFLNKNKRTRRTKQFYRGSIQRLEKREMMAAEITLSGGTLGVSGTGYADRIEVVPTQIVVGFIIGQGPLWGSGLQVTVRDNNYNIRNDSNGNPLQHSYSLWSVNQININGNSGSDFIDIDDSLSINSTLRGGSGNDTLRGGDGDDIIEGGAGDDIMRGRGGDDTYLYEDQAFTSGPIDGWYTRDFGSDDIYEEWGLGGEDTLDFSNNEVAVTVDIGNSSLQTVNSGLQIDLGSASSIENIIGSAGNDQLRGNSLDNRLEGRYGNDILEGRGGDDTYLAGYGSDEIEFKSTAAGHDTIFADYTNSVRTLDFGDFTSGIDLDLSSDDRQDVGGSLDLTFVNHSVNNVIGTDRADSIRGNYSSNTLWGGDGNDTLEGGDGSDRLYGQNGNDYLYGNDGNDYLSGGANTDRLYGGNGTDSMYGGSGNDYLYGSTSDAVVSGGSGWDYHRRASYWWWWS